ncbi:riboflavin biosynthesis protein RibF [bacterium]|nr:riboflavin biosynthesis protein RibF [bacterium]
MEAAGAAACALGVFDGLHLGHQEVIGAAVQAARELRLPALAFTFANHPQSILHPARPPRLLLTPHRRLHLLAGMGVDYLVSPSFTRDFADLSAEEFVQSVLLERFHCRVAVVGFNYHFGRNRQGTPERLRDILAELGAEAVVLAPHLVDGEPVSSTRVRGAIERGEMAEAAKLLGRLHQVEGVVIPGTGRARKLGFPTANLLVEPSLLLPPAGVYCGRAMVGEGENWHPALIYYGSRPTERELDPNLDAGLLPHVVEAHLLDGPHELADRMLQVGLGPRIRGEERFPDLATLKARIALDREMALRWTAQDSRRS